MRFTITSCVVLVGLWISAVAVAGHHEGAAEGVEEMPPVEASPPADSTPDTPIAAPAAPGEPTEGSEAADDEVGSDEG